MLQKVKRGSSLYMYLYHNAIYVLKPSGLYMVCEYKGVKGVWGW